MKIVTIYLLIGFVFLTGCSASIQDRGGKNVEGRVERGVMFETISVQGYTRQQVETKVKEFAEFYERQRDTRVIDPFTWEYKIPESGLFEVDTLKTIDRIMTSEKGQSISSIVKPITKDMMKRNLDKKIILIGQYKTKLNKSEIDRTHNIRLALEKINFYKIKPKQQFSFNQTVGNRTVNSGYKKAPVIVNTEHGPEKEEGIGGGICQISSTLFNAVEIANLKVLERHPHSRTVGYVPPGRDAAVAFDDIDFRFLNSKTHEIMIKTNINHETLSVLLYENMLKN